MKKFLTFLASAAMALGAYAVPTAQVELGELELDKEYDLSADLYKSVGGTYNATENGDLVCSNGDFAVYVNGGDTPEEGEFLGFGQGTQYKVEAGNSYYFYANFLMSSSLKLTLSGPFAVQSITPVEGSNFPVTGYTNCDIQFNKPFSCSSTKLTAGGVTKSLTARIANSTQLSIEVGETLLDLMDQNVVKAGDEFTITVSGIKCDGELYNGTGELTVTYKVPEKPVQCESTNAPSEFLSYWLPGDETGFISLTYDGNLDPAFGSCLLVWGNPEIEGECYTEELPLEIKDNTVTVNLTGKRRSTAMMTQSGKNYGTMTVQVSGVRGMNGDFAVYDDNNTGTKSFNIKYVEIAMSDVYAGFTPENGTTLVGVDKVEVYIMGISGIEFDGFVFTPQNGEPIIVPMADVKVEMGENNDATYYVPVPESVKGKGVTLTPHNLLSLDGYSHELALTAKYDTFIVTSWDPENGKELYAINLDQQVIISTNWSEEYPEMYIEGELRDMNPANEDDAILRSMLQFQRQENGDYVWTNALKQPLYKGHEYSLRVTAWESEMASHGGEPLGSDYAVYTGLTAPFAFSPTKFVSITPDPNEPLPVGTETLTVTFDGLVKLYYQDGNKGTFLNLGMGLTQLFEAVNPVNPEGELSNVWELVIPSSYYNQDRNDLNVVINAFDPDGNRVEGNSGTEDTSCLKFDYTIDKQAAMIDIIVTPAAGVVESLKTFTVKAENGQDIAPSHNAGPAYLYTKTMEQVAEVVDAEVPETGNWCTLTLDKEITEPGSYLLMIPEAYFLVGEQFTTWKNNATNIAYTIKGNEEPSTDVNVEADPASGSTVTELSQIILTFPDYSETGIGNGRPSMTFNGADASISDADFYWDGDMNQMLQSFNPALTEEGTYVITYPEGYFTLGASGQPCPSFSLTYTIGTGVGINGVFANKNGMFEVYNMMGQRVLMTANAADCRTLTPGLYIINGNKVAIR